MYVGELDSAAQDSLVKELTIENSPKLRFTTIKPTDAGKMLLHVGIVTEKLFEEAKEIIERVLPLDKTNDAHQIKHIKSCAKVSVESGDIIKIDTSDYGLNPYYENMFEGVVDKDNKHVCTIAHLKTEVCGKKIRTVDGLKQLFETYGFEHNLDDAYSTSPHDPSPLPTAHPLPPLPLRAEEIRSANYDKLFNQATNSRIHHAHAAPLRAWLTMQRYLEMGESSGGTQRELLDDMVELMTSEKFFKTWCVDSEWADLDGSGVVSLVSGVW